MKKPKALITDPPYGINYNREKIVQKKHHKSNRGQIKPVEGDDQSFDPSPWLAYKYIVLWGANCYSNKLPVQLAWLCWDKVARNNMRLRVSEMELAWAKPLRRPQMFRHMWCGAYRDSERGKAFHPTQKPVQLMKWCMDKIGVPKNCTVLDPYMGSGTTGVACIQTKRRFYGIEIDKDHFATAVRRIEAAQNDPCFDLF